MSGDGFKDLGKPQESKKNPNASLFFIPELQASFAPERSKEIFPHIHTDEFVRKTECE